MRRPVCSVGHTRPVMKMRSGWVCPECFNEHVDKGRPSPVVIPAGVAVEAHDYFTELYPNRAARRRA